MLSSIKAYFNMSKYEALALLLLCCVIVCLVIVNYSLPFYYKPPNTHIADSITTQQLAAQIQADTSNAHKWNNNYTTVTSDGSNIKGFAFNPNTLDSAGLAKLGLNDKEIHTMLNYRNKGGKYYSKADVQKMYCFSDAEYKKLEPFIQLPATKQFTNSKFVNTPKQKVIVNINTADTALFNKLYGIGPTLAQRIVDRRIALGGFTNIAQLLEVYGITDSTLQKIKPQLIVDAKQIKTINVNTVFYQTLGEHPYAKNGLAMAIIKYRKANGGAVTNITDLKNIAGIDLAQLQKLLPYLRL
jgi:competence protein ComEA